MTRVPAAFSVVFGLLLTACAASAPERTDTAAKTSPDEKEFATWKASRLRGPFYPTWGARRGRWIVFSMSDEESFWADSSSTSVDGPRIRVWVGSYPLKGKLPAEADATPRWESLTFYEMDCKQGTLQVLETIKYGDDHSVVSSSSKPRELSHPAPETIGESIYGLACVPPSPQDARALEADEIRRDSAHDANEWKRTHPDSRAPNN
jgi:hypothetical protein